MRCSPIHRQLPSQSVPSLSLSQFVFRLFLLIVCATIISSECPRKTAAQHQRQAVINEDEEEQERDTEQQPGIKPAKHFIQTSFVHRDVTDEDREFALFVELKLSELRPILYAQAQVTLDNENVDCTDNSGGGVIRHHRCQEYPQGAHFHFLVVEDSRSGAGVYSIERKLNWHESGSRARTMARIEAALLDALSRHSTHPLASYASANAIHELGFVREIGTAELEQYIRQNHAKGQKRSSASARQQSIFIHSPTELHLLNDRLIRQRRVDFVDPNARESGLIRLQGAELAELIDSSVNEGVRAVFVLFWNEASALSVHALELWSRASERWHKTMKNEAGVVLASVACHEEEELCRAFAVSHSALLRQQQMFAFRNGQRVAQQIGIGDEQFLVGWIRMVLAGPLIQLESADSINAAQQLRLPGFDDIAPLASVTLGRFRSEQQDAFRKFAQASTLLHGRYYLAYWLDKEMDEARVSTFRQKATTSSSMFGENPNHSVEEMPFLGTQFDIRTLLSHITHMSMPELIDIGHGFTSDLALSPSTKMLFIHNGTDESAPFCQWLANVVNQMHSTRIASGKSAPILLTIDVANSLPLGKFLEELKLGTHPLPILCLLFGVKAIYCAPGADPIGQLRANTEADKFAQQLLTIDESNKHEWTSYFGHQIMLDSASQPHPLAFVQLEHVNALFGKQQHIQLTPFMFKTEEDTANSEQFNPHEFNTMDSASMSGCPMMAHMDGQQQQQMREEL